MGAMKFSIDIFGMYVELNHFTLHVSGSGGNLALVLIQPPLPPYCKQKLTGYLQMNVMKENGGLQHKTSFRYAP